MKKIVAVEVKGNQPDIFLAAELEEETIEELKKWGVSLSPIEKEVDTSKKGFAFLVPILAGIPGTAVLVGAATLGVIGGAATVVGGKVVDWVWPSKKDAG